MRPFILHEFSEPTLPSGEGLSSSTGKINGQNEIFPVGTTVSLVLESRDKQKASEWRSYHYPDVKIEGDSLTRDLPALTHSEELFFRIVEYSPRPRDRYVVERIDNGAFIYAPLVEDCYCSVDHGRSNQGVEITVQLDNVELRNKYFPLNEDILYRTKRPFYKAQRDLCNGKMSQEEFEVIKAGIKRKYTETSERLRAEREVKYPIGSTAKIRVVPDEERALHETSAFLQGGDRITCKRKNIHFVGQPGTSLHVYQPKEDNFPRVWCVMTWMGQLLDPSVRKLVGRGHLVRAVCDFYLASGRCETVKYFSIVNVLPDDCLLGVLRDYYSVGWEEDETRLIGKYFIIQRDNISEIPHTWPENASIERQVNAAKLSSGYLVMTGLSAME